MVEKYRLPDVSRYMSEIKYEVHDPSEYEEGFLAKAIARGFKKYGYDIDSAINSITDDAEECAKNYAEDLVGECNDLIDRFMIDPIQLLLPKLYDTLSSPQEET